MFGQSFAPQSSRSVIAGDNQGTDPVFASATHTAAAATKYPRSNPLVGTWSCVRSEDRRIPSFRMQPESGLQLAN